MEREKNQKVRTEEKKVEEERDRKKDRNAQRSRYAVKMFAG